MRARACIIFLVLALLSLVSAITVKFPDGLVEGYVSENGWANVYKAIPFAKPPVGDLRWARPVKNDPWQGPLDATQDPPGCPQACTLPTHTCPDKTSEDCLYLNVFTPAQVAPESKLPVMVWIHGGGFEQGFGAGPFYDASLIVNRSSIVFVSLNYRLGALGFLYNGADVIGNFGFFDQQFALQWVQANIEYFGGDPSQVTIVGESAGAISVGLHLISPNSKGLFRAAIMQSNPFGLPLQTTTTMTATWKKVAQYAGCTNADLACMRTRPVDAILSAQAKEDHDFIIHIRDLLGLFLGFTPVVGTEDVPLQPMVAFQTGQLASQVPFIAGSNHDEGILFIDFAFQKYVPQWELDLVLAALFGLSKVGPLRKQYPQDPANPDGRVSASLIVTDGIFNCPARNITLRHDASVPAYLYQYQHLLSFGAAAWDGLTECINATCHGAELPILFEGGAESQFNFTQDEQTLAASLMDYWSGFAVGLDPNALGRQAQWPRVSAPQSEGPDVSMYFQTPQNFVAQGYNRNSCDFWDQFMGYVW